MSVEVALNLGQAQQRFSAAALKYDAIASLQHDVRRSLLARLPEELPAQGMLLDLGCGTGQGAKQLRAHYPDLQIFNADFAQAMCRLASNFAPAVTARAEALPLASETFDVITSSLMLQWSPDVRAVFAECRRVLKPDGRLHFATLGPASLGELRQAWAAVDSWQHVHEFSALAHLIDQVENASMQVINMRRDVIVRHYPDLTAVLRATRGIGAANASVHRRPGLMGRDALRRLSEAYEYYRDSTDSLPVSYEVFFVELAKA